MENLSSMKLFSTFCLIGHAQLDWLYPATDGHPASISRVKFSGFLPLCGSIILSKYIEYFC